MSVVVKLLYFAGAYTAMGMTQETVSLPYIPFPLTSLAPYLESLHSNTSLGKVLASSQWCVDVEMVMDPEETMLTHGKFQYFDHSKILYSDKALSILYKFLS